MQRRQGKRHHANAFAARRWKTVLLACAPGLAAVAQATDLTIYDEALQNGFLDYSYTTVAPNFSSAPAHGGANSIAFDADANQALKVAYNTILLNTADRPKLHFWFYGSSAQCQALDLILERNNGVADDTVASGALSAYANCAGIVAGQWLEISANITAAPLAYNGTFDRISWFNHNAAATGVIHLDDVSLQAGVVDAIFRNGFEGSVLPPPACPMQDEHDVNAAGMLSDRFNWCDSAGLPRVAVLAHNDGAVAGPGGTRGGDLRQFSYRVGAATRVANASSSFTAGFGYPVSHPGGDAQYCTGAKIDNLYNDPYDDNGLIGHLRGGSFTRVFEGRHHAIFRFSTTYPLYCSTVNAAPLGYIVPVTIDWMFASGHDHPLWSITWDLNGVPVDKAQFDSRAPYGELLFDGSASEGAHSDIAGVAWGDRRKFTTTSTPAKLSSSWSWNAANTIPYVKLWTSAIDATMGTVMTQTIAQKDVGGYFDVTRFWDHTSADGLPNCNGAAGYVMPCIDFWPYQSINFSFGGTNVSTNSTRLGWGTEYGFLGEQAYHIHGSSYWGGPLPDATASGWPRKSYSTYVVLGTHSGDPVGAQVAQVETVQSLTLSATVGSVATSGPAGVNRPDNATYAPAGYDHVYGALAFNAAGNALDANIAVGSGTLKKPLLVLRGCSTYPTTVKLNNAVLALDVDYFPSLRAGANELWITLNRDLSGAANRVEIIP